MISNANTVEEYLASLSPEVRDTLSTVRATILQHLPEGYKEVINWGAISYEVPLATYPKTYNGQPLSFAGLAAQKNYRSLYLMCTYMNPPLENRLRQAFKAAGKRLDMGKSCIRFKKADDLPLEAIGQIIASMPVDKYIAAYESARNKST